MELVWGWRGTPDKTRAPKVLMKVRILQNNMSSIPCILGLRTREWRTLVLILYYMILYSTIL